jgi:hypothetical protein
MDLILPSSEKTGYDKKGWINFNLAWLSLQNTT